MLTLLLKMLGGFFWPVYWEIEPEQLQDINISLIILGHSERKSLISMTDFISSRKV